MPTVGRKAPDKPHTRSIVFDKAKWTVEKAKTWLKEHDHFTDGLHETEDSYRFRQYDPTDGFKIRNQDLGNGISLVQAYAARAFDGQLAFAGGLNYDFTFDEETQTYTILDFELFEPGTWNGEAYPLEFVTHLAAVDAEVREVVRPRVKIGHPDDRPDAEDPKGTKAPAYGWLGPLRMKGNKLVADLTLISKELFAGFQKGTYARQSVELEPNYRHPKTGKLYKWVLDAVGFLGAKRPAIPTLKPITALDEDEPMRVVLFMDEKEAPSGAHGDASIPKADDADKDAERGSKQMPDGDLKAREDALAKERNDLKAKMEALEEERKHFDAARKAATKEKVDRAWVDLSNEGRCKPAEEEEFRRFAGERNDSKRLTFADGREMTELDSFISGWMARPVIAKKTTPEPAGRADEKPDKRPADIRMFAQIEKLAKDEDTSLVDAAAAWENDEANKKLYDEYRKQYECKSAPPAALRREEV